MSVCSNYVRHHKSLHVSNYCLHLHIGPQSFSPLDYCLSTRVCSKSAQTCISLCFRWAKTCLASCTRDPASSPKSCRLIDRVKVRHNSGGIKPDVSWRTNSSVERARSAGALSCNGATVSMETETVQVILDPYQTFHPQSVRQMNTWNLLCQKPLITCMFWWSCSTIP